MRHHFFVSKIVSYALLVHDSWVAAIYRELNWRGAELKRFWNVFIRWSSSEASNQTYGRDGGCFGISIRSVYLPFYFTTNLKNWSPEDAISHQQHSNDHRPSTIAAHRPSPTWNLPIYLCQKKDSSAAILGVSEELTSAAHDASILCSRWIICSKSQLKAN